MESASTGSTGFTGTRQELDRNSTRLDRQGLDSPSTATRQRARQRLDGASTARQLEKYTFEFYVGDCTKFEVLAKTATDNACAIARLRQVIETRIERGFWALGACPCGGKRS